MATSEPSPTRAHAPAATRARFDPRELVDPWARGAPQAIALVAMLCVGSEPFFAGVTRGTRFWSLAATLAAILLALPWAVHALRDPARGPRRACPPRHARAVMGWLLAFVAAALLPMVLARSVHPSAALLGCALALYPFFGLAVMRALGWSHALREARAAAQPHRGGERFVVSDVDAAAGTLELARDGAPIFASAPSHLLRDLARGAEVYARLDSASATQNAPYRVAPAHVLAIETAQARTRRRLDHAGALLGMARAVAWALIPFALFAGRWLGEPIPDWRPF